MRTWEEDSELPQEASAPPPGVNSACDLTSTTENQRGKWISHHLTQIGNRRAWIPITFAALHDRCILLSAPDACSFTKVW